MNLQVIILAAGKGTRMQSDLPKVLTELEGKSLIRRLLESIKHLGQPHPPIVVVGHRSDAVCSHLGQEFQYALQAEQLGTANAVAAALPNVISENVLVLYGDMPFIRPSSVNRLLKLHEEQKSLFSMFTTTVPNFDGQFAAFANFGRIIRSAPGQIAKITEMADATAEEKDIVEVNPAIYIFNTEWLKANLPKVRQNSRGEFYLTDLVEIAMKTETSITSAPIDCFEVYGINTPSQLQVARELVRRT